MISIVCVLYVIFILRNLQKNGWEREKSWITFGHTYYILKFPTPSNTGFSHFPLPVVPPYSLTFNTCLTGIM